MLIVETGTVQEAGANSYVSLEDCAAYHLALGNDAWANADEATKEPAILRAMAWFETLDWKGKKAAYGNPLAWPRKGVTDKDGYNIPATSVPAGVIRALCEAALIELETPGELRPVLKRGGRIVSQSIEGVGSWTYAPDAPEKTVYQSVVGLLSGLLKEEKDKDGKSASVMTLQRG